MITIPCTDIFCLRLSESYVRVHVHVAIPTLTLVDPKPSTASISDWRL